MDIRVRAEQSTQQKSTTLCHTKLHYFGEEWIGARLPTQCEPWLPRNRGYAGTGTLSQLGLGSVESSQTILRHQLQWPQRTICFIADAHADTDALIASLVASGGIAKLGIQDQEFELTKAGKKALFLIAGDCFDKGPGNLRLLRMIRLLMIKGARVRMLAGGRDVRMLHGMHPVGLDSDSPTGHFFVRLGARSVPLLSEIWDQYLKGGRGLRDVPGLRECYRRLYPSKQWFAQFPHMARRVMDENSTEQELKRLQQKIADFEQACQQSGMTLRMVYAAVRQWQRLFMCKNGEFAWFFRRMRLVHQDGSFLFIHHGLGDNLVEIIAQHGVKNLNRIFGSQLVGEPFNFFYGPLANAMWSKDQEVEMPLTGYGIELANKQGVLAIVHAHSNRLHGQRIFVRQGMINFECDATLDRASRKREGLQEIGAVATVFTNEQQALGISSDYPRVKLFDPRQMRTL